jgi:glycosyltransferase involved in cell wall biosynthesis
LGEGGDTFSPHDVRALAEKMARISRDPVYRDGLVVRAKERALDFSWRRTAELTYDLYRSCVRS